MPGVERNCEQRAAAPFEGELAVAAVLPYLRRTATIDDVIDFFVQMALGVERPGARHFDHVHAPQVFGAEQLNRRAAPAEPLPRFERQVLDFMHADVPMDRYTLVFDKQIVGRLGILPLAEAGFLALRRRLPFKYIRAWFYAHEMILL